MHGAALAVVIAIPARVMNMNDDDNHYPLTARVSQCGWCRSRCTHRARDRCRMKGRALAMASWYTKASLAYCVFLPCIKKRVLNSKSSKFICQLKSFLIKSAFMILISF
jgi:hypothetical protein